MLVRTKRKRSAAKWTKSMSGKRKDSEEWKTTSQENNPKDHQQNNNGNNKAKQ